MSTNVYLAVNGDVIDITKVKDLTFSEKMIGDGMAIIPNDENICSPISGKITSIFPTNHAFIVSNESANVMVHIGLDTVELKGDPFVRIKEVWQKVNAGDIIIRSDYKSIIEQGFDPVVIVIAIEGTVKNKCIEKSNCSIKDILYKII